MFPLPWFVAHEPRLRAGKKLGGLCSEVSWLCFEVGTPYSEVGGNFVLIDLQDVEFLR